MPEGVCRIVGVGLAFALAGAVSAAAPTDPGAVASVADGENPHPVRLVRPPVAPLSAMARLGRLIFFDPPLVKAHLDAKAAKRSGRL